MNSRITFWWTEENNDANTLGNKLVNISEIVLEDINKQTIKLSLYSDKK